MQNAELLLFRILHFALSTHRMSRLSCDLYNIALVIFLIITRREIRYLALVMTAQPPAKRRERQRLRA